MMKRYWKTNDFYRRFTIWMIMLKVLMFTQDFTKECSCSDDVLPSTQVFYASASASNALGKFRSVWLFKGISPHAKLNSRYRLLTALRLLLLIMAGDVELNPGPMATIESFPQGVLEPENSLLTNCPCVKCAVDCVEDCIQCEYCLRWEHNHCSNLTRSMCLQAAKFDNLVYLCDECKSTGMNLVGTFRRIFYKFKDRGVTLGKLLDTYDAATTSTPTTASQPATMASTTTQTEADQGQPEAPDLPEHDVEATICDQTRNDDQDSIVLDEIECKSEPIIVKGQSDPRSNFYRFDFNFEGVSYRSLEHAYQCIKAKMCGCNFASLAWDIRHAASPQEAKRLANRLPRMATKILHDLMFDLLKAKVSQCYSFRKSLRDTGSQKIFHSTYENVDTYWCTGLDYRDIKGHHGEFVGLNVFGQMLETIRDSHLLEEQNYETRVKYLEASNFVVLLYDGEANLYPSDFYRDSDFYRRGSGYHRYSH
jgi:ribA/ribD-fused uncharacterized protein